MSTTATLAERFEALVNHYGLGNQHTVAQMVKLPTSLFTDLIAGRVSGLRFKHLQQMATYLPGLNANWLLLGTGTMLGPKPVAEPENTNSIPRYDVVAKLGETIVPLVDGELVERYLDHQYAWCKTLRYPTSMIAPGNNIALEVATDEMLPLLGRGDVAIFRQLAIYDWGQLTPGVCFVVTRSRKPFIARVTVQSAQEVLTCSFDGEQPSEQVALREVAQLWTLVLAQTQRIAPPPVKYTTDKAAATTTLGVRLVQLRKEKGLTQTAVGQAIGITKGGLSHLEGDRSKPAADTLQLLEEFYGVKLSDFLPHPPLSAGSQRT